MKEKIEKNINKKIIYLLIILIIGFIIYSFVKYIDDYYTYGAEYYSIKEECDKGLLKDEKCEIVNSLPSLKEKFENNEDAITLYFNVNYNYFFDKMLLLFPLIIIIIVTLKLYPDFKSGNIKNYLMRESLNKYKKRINKEILKTALLIPISMIIIFIISCLITKFDFTVADEIKKYAIYDKWNYNNFPLYIILHCLILYLMGIFYGNIASCYLNKCKNIILSIIYSYITLFITIISVWVFYGIVLNNIGFKWLMNYFNLLDFWHIYGSSTNYIGVLIVSIVCVILSYIIKERLYLKKERVIIENEK